MPKVDKKTFIWGVLWVKYRWRRYVYDICCIPPPGGDGDALVSLLGSADVIHLCIHSVVQFQMTQFIIIPLPWTQASGNVAKVFHVEAMWNQPQQCQMTMTRSLACQSTPSESWCVLTNIKLMSFVWEGVDLSHPTNRHIVANFVIAKVYFQILKTIHLW